MQPWTAGESDSEDFYVALAAELRLDFGSLEKGGSRENAATQPERPNAAALAELMRHEWLAPVQIAAVGGAVTVADSESISDAAISQAHRALHCLRVLSHVAYRLTEIRNANAHAMQRDSAAHSILDQALALLHTRLAG